MPAPEIRPFTDDDLDAAAALLADRHRRHRKAEPLLPQRYEAPAATREQIAALWRADDYLLSSRFWPRRGFRPTFLRVYRSIP